MSATERLHTLGQSFGLDNITPPRHGSATGRSRRTFRANGPGSPRTRRSSSQAVSAGARVRRLDPALRSRPAETGVRLSRPPARPTSRRGRPCYGDPHQPDGRRRASSRLEGLAVWRANPAAEPIKVGAGSPLARRRCPKPIHQDPGTARGPARDRRRGDLDGFTINVTVCVRSPQVPSRADRDLRRDRAPKSRRA